MASPSYRLPFVLDADTLIRLARSGILGRLGAEEGLLIVPFKVDEEIRGWRHPRRRRSVTQDWLSRNAGIIKRFQTTEEHRLYYSLIAREDIQLGEGESAAIAMASRRAATLCSGDRAARSMAQKLGVGVATPDELAAYLVPPLL